MPVAFITMAIAGIYYTMQATKPRWCYADSTLWNSRYKDNGMAPVVDSGFSFSWHKNGMWPRTQGFCSDPAIPASLILSGDIGTQVGAGQGYGHWYYGYGGCQSSKFIMGQCKRSTGEPLGGAVVKGFRTSDNLFAGQAQSDDNGMYELPTPNTGSDAHFLVAYYDSASDLAGSTVNTLIPTWRDGSV